MGLDTDRSKCSDKSTHTLLVCVWVLQSGTVKSLSLSHFHTFTIFLQILNERAQTNMGQVFYLFTFSNQFVNF